MRQIGTIADENAARALADYLLTLKIETKLDRQAGGWEVWVCDEDQLPRAREELAAFTANPSDTRFTAARRTAEGIRRAEEQADEDYRRRQAAARRQIRTVAAGRMPVTAALIAISVVVGLFTQLGKSNEGLQQQLRIEPYHPVAGNMIEFKNLSSIRKGQVWRLVTPIFLHFGPLHLLFNMMWMYTLGGLIEARRGPLRYVAIVLLIAVFSNLGEYYLGGVTLEGGRIMLQYHPNFGGMSGVVFGLFGYAWMKMRFEPQLGIGMSQQTFILTLVWLILCFTGLVGAIANGAHVCGLVTGMALGAAPAAWRRFRG